MDRQKGEVENELDEVVSISDRINRVLERSSESEDACGSRRIDRQCAPSERSCAQRRYVRADEAIRETKVVPDEGPDVSEQVVAYRHRLRPLKVGVAGHGGVRVCFGKVEEGELESQDPLPHGDDRLAYEQAFVERNLVVPTPSGVELRPERSQAFRERHLDIRVNVFEILPPNEATRGDLFVDASKAFPEELRLPFREDADRGEHLDVGEAPRDVVTRQPSVDRQGDDEPRGRRLHVRRRGSASRPLRLDRGRHFHFALFAAFTSFVEAGAFAPAAAQVRAGSPQT